MGKREDQNDSSPRQAFLLRLESEASRTLGTETAQALSVEVAAHLDESIQARLELGEPMEIAELRAVASFGELHTVVSNLAAIHEPQKTKDKTLFCVGLVLVAWVSLYVVFEIFPIHLAEYAFFIFMGGIVLGLLSFAVVSFRLSSPRLKTLGKLCAATTFMLCGVAPFMWLNLSFHGGMGYVPVSQMAYVTHELSHPSPRESIESALSWAPDDTEYRRSTMQAIDEALREPIGARYGENLPEFVPGAVIACGFLFVFHMGPVCLRRRWRSRRTNHRGLSA